MRNRWIVLATVLLLAVVVALFFGEDSDERPSTARVDDSESVNAPQVESVREQTSILVEESIDERPIPTVPKQNRIYEFLVSTEWKRFNAHAIEELGSGELTPGSGRLWGRNENWRSDEVIALSRQSELALEKHLTLMAGLWTVDYSDELRAYLFDLASIGLTSVGKDEASEITGLVALQVLRLRGSASECRQLAILAITNPAEVLGKLMSYRIISLNGVDSVYDSELAAAIQQVLSSGPLWQEYSHALWRVLGRMPWSRMEEFVLMRAQASPQATDALRYITDPAAIEVVRAALQHGTWGVSRGGQVVRNAAAALIHMGTSESTEILLAVLRDPNDEAKRYAIMDAIEDATPLVDFKGMVRLNLASNLSSEVRTSIRSRFGHSASASSVGVPPACMREHKADLREITMELQNTDDDRSRGVLQQILVTLERTGDASDVDWLRGLSARFPECAPSIDSLVTQLMSQEQ